MTPRREGPRPDGHLSARPEPRQEGAPLSAGVHHVGTGPRGPHLLVVPAGRAEPSRLLVFFHGAGGVALDGLEVLHADGAAEDVALLLPTSTFATWDLLSGGLGPDLQALDDALAVVFALLPVVEVAVAGFSDGASYALSVGLANGDLLPAVMAFSPGFVAAPGQVGRPRVWVSHGTQDRVLPIDRCGRRVVRTLQQAGYEVHYEEFAGGHDFTASLVTTALRWWRGRPEP